MKRIILLSSIIVIALTLSGCTKQTINDSITTTVDENTNTTIETNQNKNSNTVIKDTNTNQKVDTVCAWIDESDVVIQLDLPEEYAHYNDKTIFPSYETGFLFKSSYGDTARLVRLARKNCDYRVGFDQADFAELNMDPNYPLVAYGEKDSTHHFTSENEPIKITLNKDNLPTQGNSINLKVTGEVAAFNHFDAIFK